jgi:hypothetical protein
MSHTLQTGAGPPETSSRMWFRHVVGFFVLIGCVLAAIATTAVAQQLRIDFDPANDRADVLTPGWESWRVDDGQHTESRKFGDVTVTVIAAAAIDAVLRTESWKGGYDTGATLVSDGVVADNVMEIRVSGLAPGNHTVALWHNVKLPAYALTVDRAVIGKPRSATWRVAHDTDAQVAYTPVTAERDRDVVIRITAAEKDRPIYLNAPAIDTADPTALARKPSPSDDD